MEYRTDTRAGFRSCGDWTRELVTVVLRRSAYVVKSIRWPQLEVCGNFPLPPEDYPGVRSGDAI